MVENGSMFPPNIASDAETGAKLMKIAGILYLTIILIIIGFILEVIGYFKLSSLKNLSGEARAPVTSTQPAPAQPSPAAQSQPAKKFCPNCGAQVSGSEKYCPSCGSEL
ncbi:MAG: zinc-ribbon domain-containing protein [Candidatus Lokiarchaeota archaeon]|nr:zinc-ribbon domain-containing protein [Candidatus Lokiarchaeota archaeon]